MSDIEEAFKTITNKRAGITLLYSYANGPQPLRYSTERLRQAFDDLSAHFDLNYCSMVINSTLDRLGITGFSGPSSEATNKLTELFDDLHIDLEAMKTHNSSLIAQEGYIIAWKNGTETEIYYNDPRMVEVFYSHEKPKEKTYAAKLFELDNGGQEMTLYYPAKLEHWQSDKKSKDSTKANDFTLIKTEQNPYGVIPVFCLHSDGELGQITTLQDAINKLFSDMMVSAEFGAFVQRYVISQSDPGQLKNGPDMVWWVPSGDGSGQGASVGQFTPTALNGYLEAMDKLATDIAIITRTPKHYLLSSGANISGEALLAMENPLVRKVKTLRIEFGSAWQDVAAFLLKMNGIEVVASDITVIWERPESIQPYTEAQTRDLGIKAGIPLATLLTREGWSKTEIENMQKEADNNSKKLSDGIGKTLADAQRTLDATKAQPVPAQTMPMVNNGSTPA